MSHLNVLVERYLSRAALCTHTGSPNTELSAREYLDVFVRHPRRIFRRRHPQFGRSHRSLWRPAHHKAAKHLLAPRLYGMPVQRERIRRGASWRHAKHCSHVADQCARREVKLNPSTVPIRAPRTSSLVQLLIVHRRSSDVGWDCVS
eukprot:SAG31_NODE_2521_length_5566_cov_2.201939_3_plen_147_part_00